MFGDKVENKMESEGLVVDYMINAPCNLHCPFCYGPPPDMKKELSISNKIKLVKNLSLNNVYSIVFGGGEPFLSSDLNRVIKFGSDFGVRMAIQTNGFYIERAHDILSSINWIGIPLDGISQRAQLAMRTNKEHFSKTMHAIEYVSKFKKEYSQLSPRIKVGTVISNYNIQELDEMAVILCNSDIDVWKLYMIRERGKGKKLHQSYFVKNDIVEDKIYQIRRKFPSLNIYYSHKPTTDSYVIIDPDSSAYVIRDGKENAMGYLINENNEFDSSAWVKILDNVDYLKLKSNIINSFPNWVS